MSLTSNAERYPSLTPTNVSPLAPSQPELSPIESPVKVLEAEVQVLKKKISTSQTNNEALEMMCQEYKAQLQQKTLEAERAIEQKEIVMKRNERLLSMCEELNSCLKKDLGALELQNYLFEVRRLKSELDKKEKDVVSLSAQNSNLSKENSTIRNLSTTLESTITELTARNEELENLCNEFRKQLLYSLTSHENETDQNKILLDEWEQLNSSLKEKDNSEAEQLFPKENTEIRGALTTLERIRGVIVRGMATVTALKTRNGFLETTCQQLISQVEQKTLEAAEQLQNHQEEVEKLNADWKRKDKELESCIQEVVDLLTVNASLKSEVESLKKPDDKQTPNGQVSTKKRKAIESPIDEETEPSRKKRSCNENIDSKSVVIQKVKEFKMKWRNAKHRSDEQNMDIDEIYKICRKAAMNFHEIVEVKRNLAKFLGIQMDNVRIDLPVIKTPSLPSTSTADRPFVFTLATSPVSSAQMSPQESNAAAPQYFPPLPLMDEDDIKREDSFQINSPDQQVPNMEEIGQSTSFIDSSNRN